MFKTILPVIILAAAVAAPALARPMMPRPPAGTVLTDGATVTIEGTLSVKNLEGRHAWLGEFTKPVYERHNLYYPAVMPRPGIMPHPRPPFMYRQVKQLALFGGDALQAAALLGTEVHVKVTGTVYDSLRAMIRGLKIEKIELRGQPLPSPLPSVQRLIASAKKAVQAELASSGLTLVGDLKAHHEGALLVTVTGRARGTHGGSAAPVRYTYDGVTGNLSWPERAE